MNHPSVGHLDSAAVAAAAAVGVAEVVASEVDMGDPFAASAEYFALDSHPVLEPWD